VSLSATAHSKFFIGTSKACLVLADYTSDTYVEVTSISDLGEVGDSSDEIKFLAIGNARVLKLKGTRDAGDITITVGRDHSDPGQLAMKAAAIVDNGFNFKVQLNDAAAGAPSMIYFSGVVLESRTKFGTANTVTENVFKVGVTTAPIEVPAV